MPRPKLMNSARVLVYINGRLFGICTSFAWTSHTPRRKVRAIDIPFPIELAPTTAEVDWTMGVLRLLGDGGMQGHGLAVPMASIVKEKYFTIELIERATNLSLFKADYCVTDSEQWSVAAKDLVRGNLTGTGIIWGNEASR